MAEEYTRLRHNVETEQWLAEGHRDYAAATTDITAVLDLLRDMMPFVRAAACQYYIDPQDCMTYRRKEKCPRCTVLFQAKEAGIPDE